jgi:hypothetical protein
METDDDHAQRRPVRSWNGDSGQRWVALAAVAEVLAAHHEDDAGVTVDAAFWITTARIDDEGADGPTASTSSPAGHRTP